MTLVYILMLALVLAKEELSSWNSQYVLEVFNKTQTWESSSPFFNISSLSPPFAFHQIDMPFTFSFFFAPLRQVFIDSVGHLHFNSQHPCCTNISDCLLYGSNSSCDLNTSYYNLIVLFLGDQNVSATVHLNSSSLEVRYSGLGVDYGVALYNDSSIEINLGQLPNSSSDWLVGLRRAVESGPADSTGDWSTAIAGVYPPQELIIDDSSIIFCPITTIFCVTPNTVSSAGGDILSVIAGLSDLNCIRKRISLSCKFMNSANNSEFILTNASVSSTTKGVLQCSTPAMPRWNSAELRLVKTSTGQELFHDSRSLLNLTVEAITLSSRSICERCQQFTSASNCPIDCANVTLGNATLDDCRICVLNGTPNLDKNCRGECFSAVPVPAGACLCNQSGIPIQNRGPVNGACWNGLPIAQPALQDILRTTDIVNVYRFVAVIFCGIGLVLLPFLWTVRTILNYRRSRSHAPQGEDILLR